VAVIKAIQNISIKRQKLAHRIAVFILGVLLVLPVPQHLLAEQDPLTLGLFPRRSAKLTFEMFSPLAEYLSTQLGRPVQLETAASFDDFWNGVTTTRYDIAHYNQYHYIRSHRKLGYDVVAMNEEFGNARIAGSIDVRVDSNVNKLQDLKGEKIVFGGGPKAMMSYIIPTYLLRMAGLEKGDYQEDFAKNPPNAILSTYYKQSKAAGVGAIVLHLPLIKSNCDVAKLKHLAVSETVAHLPWAVKASLPKQLKLKIQSILINMAKTIKGKSILKQAGLTDLVTAKDSDYDRHREIIFTVLGEQY
jgi:phosphonate transport system substrate-binding protein